MRDAVVPANDTGPANWWVQVRGQTYGPYTLAQLAGFVGEGRVRANTPVSDNPSSGWLEAGRTPALAGQFSAGLARREAEAAQMPATDTANVFVFAEIHSSAWNGFLAALEAMGSMCEIAPGLWLVRTRHSAGIIRNTLSQTLERGDRFVVIDATRDRMAWYNLGPGVDVRLKDVLNSPARG